MPEFEAFREHVLYCKKLHNQTEITMEHSSSRVKLPLTPERKLCFQRPQED